MNQPHSRADSRSGHSADPPADLVRNYVDKISKSGGFDKSERLKRFLRFAVDRVLAGDTGALKEYAIALEVFDRTPDYDPKVDAVVRVEARRLRQRLQEYYALEGARDSVQIQFPVGTYVPFLVSMPPSEAAKPVTKTGSPRSWWWLFGAAAGAIFILVFTHNWQVRKASPEIVRLVKDASAAFDPAISRDGKILAFASDQSGNVDIWVRSVEGGNAQRITSNDAIDRSPDFSPDASKVVFRSERNGGGVYLVASAGGPERLVVPLGQSPKFSPDGKWIAFWTGAEHHFEGKVFIVPSAGGTAIRIAADLADARWPLWSPNGEFLLVYGSRSRPNNSGATSGPADLFLAPIKGGPVQETRWSTALRGAGIHQGPTTTGRSSWNGEILRFSATTGASNEFSGVTQEVANLWQIRLTAQKGVVEGEPRRLTYGAASEGESVFLPDGGAIYSSSRYTLTPFEITLDERELPGANSRELFSSQGGYILPRISRDGSAAVALSDRSGQIDIWLKDFRKGTERALTASSTPERIPLISDDGGTIYYGLRQGGTYPMYRLRASGGAPESVCADCGTPSDVSPNGNYVLYHAGEPWSAYSLNLITGGKQLVAGNNHRIYSSSFNADGRWIVFLSDSGDDASPRRVFVAPFLTNRSSTEADWIPITDGLHRDFDPVWSPSGRMIFFISDRDGNRCIWAVRLNSDKRVLGEPFPLIHLHRLAQHIPATVGASVFGISPGHHRLIFGAMNLSSEIYRLQDVK